MILGLIPARLNSQRLPGKPLIEIDGLPLIIHVLKRSLLCKKLDKVIVCADDKSIIQVVEKFGGEAILTSRHHKNGTERICAVAKKFKAQIIIDIQCDEAFLDPKHLDKLIDFHKKNKNLDIVIPHSQISIYNNKNGNSNGNNTLRCLEISYPANTILRVKAKGAPGSSIGCESRKVLRYCSWLCLSNLITCIEY